eukprot:869467-Pelagomonas_calceolata.AAC.3
MREEGVHVSLAVDSTTALLRASSKVCYVESSSLLSRLLTTREMLFVAAVLQEACLPQQSSAFSSLLTMHACRNKAALLLP